jgi:nitroreductase
MRIPLFDKLNTWHYINKCFRFDRRVFVKYSRAIKTKEPNHILAKIAINTHIIEKGLTMPGMRHGFGQQVVSDTIMLCHTWAESYDKSNPVYIQAIRTIQEYRLLHQKLNYTFSKEFGEILESFAEENKGIDASCQLVFEGAEQFFSKRNAEFPEFARSRHSVRNYSDENIPVQQIMDAIDLAQTAPSACNRQSTRVHIITDKKQISDILALQNGNRGFGHLANKLLIITFLIPNYTSAKERNMGYIDTGFFSMNLLYALHYNQIAACTLNWCDSSKDDSKLRSIVHIDENEKISHFIVCGYAPKQTFKVAKSNRLNGNLITTVH